jgi:hypothetical protein
MPMLMTERIAALDAALVACEGVENFLPDDLRCALNMLRYELDPLIEKTLKLKSDLNDYPKIQRQAVMALACSPEVFGLD